MNDQRQTRLARRRDVGAEIADLVVLRTVLVVIVEPRLADTDDTRMRRVRDQGRRLFDRLRRRFVRMHPDRAPHVVVSLGDPPNAVESFQLRPDRQHRADAGRPRPHDNLVELRPEVGKIEMTMTIDEHDL